MLTLGVRILGRLDRHADPHPEEDLYSVFSARADMMRCATTRLPREDERLFLWGMNEAELDPDPSGSAVAVVQVAVLSPSVLIPLVRCLVDAVEWFGTLEMHGIVLEGLDGGDLRFAAGDLATYTSALNWFGRARRAAASARVDVPLPADVAPSVAVTLDRGLKSANTGPFGFANASVEPNGVLVPVRLPDWSAEAVTTAAGFVLAVGDSPVETLTVRRT